MVESPLGPFVQFLIASTLSKSLERCCEVLLPPINKQ